MLEVQRKTTIAESYKIKMTPYRSLRIISIIVIVILYSILTTVTLVLYGPFENVRRTVVGAVLTSRHPWYITPFFSEEALKKYQPLAIDTMSKGNMAAGDFSNIHTDKIEVIPIKTMKYSGSLLIIEDPTRVHIAVTRYLNSVGETVSDMAKTHQAIGGINAGGFFDVKGKGTGGIPMGITISRGEFVSGDKKTLQPVIGITKEGALVVGKYNYAELEQLGIEDAISFGPELVRDGKPFLTETDDSWGIAPRSAIGQRKDGAIMLLALSGRGNEGIGGSLLDCVDIMLQHGAYTAANLDGGYSTELYYQGEFLVTPSNPLGERYVATSFVIDGVKQ